MTSIRLPQELLDRSDRLVLLSAMPYSGLTRSDVVRMALAEGLAVLEAREMDRSAPKKRRR